MSWRSYLLVFALDTSIDNVGVTKERRLWYLIVENVTGKDSHACLGPSQRNKRNTLSRNLKSKKNIGSEIEKCFSKYGLAAVAITDMG